MSEPSYSHVDEREPLTRAPTYASQTGDVVDEPPPTYGEAIHTHDGPVLTGGRVPPTIQAGGHSYVSRPLEEMIPEEPNQTPRPNTPPRPTRIKLDINSKGCLLKSVGGFVFVGFVVAGIGGTFRFDEIVSRLIFSGTQYVSEISNPTPPIASNATIQQNKDYFLIYVIIGMLIAFPFFLCGTLVVIPWLFGIPSEAFKMSASEAQRRRTQRGNKARKGRLWTSCCGLIIVYWTLVGLLLWGILHLGDTKLVSTYNQETQHTVGNYVQLNRNASALLYSPSGKLFGNVNFNEGSLSWTMQINGASGNLTEIIYSGVTYSADPDEIHLTAYCSDHGTNGSGNGTRLCFTGNLLPYYLSLSPVKHYPGEFQGNINLTLFANQSNTFNNSPSVDLYTSRLQYQGIGHTYPPVGQWYVNNTVILTVLWNMTSNRACDGLRVILAENVEVLSWSVLGIVWKWWNLWADGGGCT
jgi:hypothetical protein